MPKLKTNKNELLEAIVNSIESIKGNQIISLNFTKIENSICDFFVICSGTSSTHVRAIQENVRKKVHKTTKQKPWHTEEDNKANWILMDYSNIILHIFQEETRTFYNLEELWGDAKKISYKEKINE
jgi:ribosome-associated protein